MTDRTDNFNRADAGTLGTPSDGGSAWVENAGTWGIQANKVFKSLTTGTFQAASLEASVANVEVQSTYSTIGNSGLVARLADNNNFIFGQATATQMFIYKRVGGTFTQIGSTFNGTISAGDVIKLRCDSANLLTLYQNGVSRVSGTDSAGLANTKHGYCFNDTASSRWDNFSITGIVSGGTLKKFNGLIVASIKTFDGLVKASTKTVNGLTP